MCLSFPTPTTVCMYVYIYMYGHHRKLRIDQPGKVVNPARGQLNREIISSLSPFAPENLVSLDGIGHPVLRQAARSPR